jgi:hypothetical protein
MTFATWRTWFSLGTAEAGEIRTEKNRSAIEESHCSEANESCSPEEIGGFDEGAMGSEEESWREGSLEA